MNSTNCTFTDMDHNAYIWYLRIVGLFSTPTCLFVIYLIWKHSPPKAGAYRGYLLCYAISGCVMDIYFTIAVNPVVFLPHMAGYTRGLISYFPGATTPAMYFFDLNLGTILMSSVMLLMHQFRAMLPGSILPCWTKKTNLIIYIVWFSLISSFFVYSVITDFGWFHKRAEYGSKIIPCLAPMFNLPSSVFVELQFTEDIVYMVMGLNGFFAIFCAGGSAATVVTLNKIQKPTSAKTIAMHKRFLKRLILQVSIPYILLILPYVVFSYEILMGDQPTEYLGDIVLGIVALHGFVSAISILLANEHYYKLIKGPEPQSPISEIDVSVTTV